VGFAAALALAACGGGGSGTDGSGGVTNSTGTTPTPTPCSQKILDQGSDDLKSKWVLYYDFSVPETGRLDVTLDWTYASNTVGVYVVAAGTCGTLEEFNARNCNFVLRSDTGAKPRKVSVTNVAAGNYRWLFANFGTADDSISYQVVLSTGSCAPLTGGGPAASAVGAAEKVDAARPSVH
jgi:hypothetical protein